MKRLRKRTLILCLIAGVLCLGARPPVSFAEDEQPAKGEDTQGEEKASKTIEWVEGWAVGRAKAEEDGKLIFLYVVRYTPG